MIIETLFFYVFAAVLVLSGLSVITAKNPVHAVLFLILAFFNAAGLFVMLGAEFVAMTLVIVYVGAVAVLFLFIVMMLDIDFANLRQGMKKHAPIGALVGLVLLAQLVWVYLSWKTSGTATMAAAHPSPDPNAVPNTHALGQVLYTHYVYPFQVAGLILLVAMIGAIALTLRGRGGVLRQNVLSQVSRRRGDVVKMKKVPIGEGVE